ncbi:hypothetical protein ACJJTC_016387 [Scirpophaga incertulas]
MVVGTLNFTGGEQCAAGRPRRGPRSPSATCVCCHEGIEPLARSAVVYDLAVGSGCSQPGTSRHSVDSRSVSVRARAGHHRHLLGPRPAIFIFIRWHQIVLLSGSLSARHQLMLFRGFAHSR